ncbi:hypothetical protein HHK36_003865 [Tetracentron sinense]|uniref:Pentatricopeptide repeat-containing protein n=1 Tax=Tetracentron sinense TaxID=13715 RepID=A0A835DPH2_TETSI|nr:hypothetical protein HHK36_003865 [Tetracentron sinense]
MKIRLTFERFFFDQNLRLGFFKLSIVLLNVCDWGRCKLSSMELVLVSMYTERGEVDVARIMFEKMPERDVSVLER